MEMTAVKLWMDLQSRGVRLTAHGETLRAIAPRGVLTSDLGDEVARLKAELLRLVSLQQEAQQAAIEAGSTPECLCGGCWGRLSELALRLAKEGRGYGFRCVDCLMRSGGDAAQHC